MLSFRTVEKALQRAGRRAGGGSGGRRRLFCAASCAAAVFLVSLVSFGQVSAQNLQSDEQQSSTIRGTVVNAVTHTPIARALVRSTDNHFAVLTDGEGHFEFALPKPVPQIEGNVAALQEAGAWPLTLTARKPGFLENRFVENRGGVDWVEAHAGSDVTIPLMPEGLITGRVTLSTGDAATGISLQIVAKEIQEGRARWVMRGTTRANAAGEFRFAELQAGSYKLFTNELLDNDPAVSVRGSQSYGFAPVFYPNAADFSSGGTIELAAGQTVEADFSLTHQPYYDVKIPVANGEAAGMNITVMVQGHRGPGYSLGYNGGTQKIEGMLPSGNYTVEADSYGQDSMSGAVNLKVAGAAAEGPVMTLVRNGSISVNVKEEFSDTAANNAMGRWTDGTHRFSLRGPRAYLQVTAEPADDFERTRTGNIRPPTGADDNLLVIEDLPPGRYWLRVTSGIGYVAAASAGATDLLHEPLMIAAGSNTPIEVKMRDDWTEIDGSVAGLSSEGASAGTGTEAFVYCVPSADGAGIFKYGGVSSDGKFQLDVAPGDYRALAFARRQPNLPYRDAEAMRAYETKGQVVHVSAGQKTSVQLQVIGSSE